ncbi:protein-tyrosine phosphatase-like protein [Crepidotus variabilis]|uniref:Protein-tyrosine phosphatase-like protein n=1 Tax=Crepidotus variabilis TaxID=179855 RepID=A0A9P6EGS0_9AGAR|nr:protein-tyrosine phosphatase-like protein [Crepidotus variabilis]
MDLLLQHLASQYHESDYNRAKFGSRGSPIYYTPLSLHLPERFNELRAQQLQLAHNQPWWPAAHGQPCLQDEIMTAMSTSLFPPQPLPPTNLKTSSSHPINISAMISPDLVHLISSHALLASSASPTLLEIPATFALHRLTSLRDPRSLPNCQISPSLSPLKTRRDLTDAMQAAIATGLDPPGKRPVISQIIPAAKVSVAFSLRTITPRPFPVLPSFKELLSALPQRADPETAVSPAANQQSGVYQITPSVVIGNLYLSSCPGKKVRLNGPVRGRSGVCRDLETDMTRMKQLGVACIVCCLDDDELDFLGAPWADYEYCANKIGMDVLRLPTPEGLPPISAAHLDGYLVDLIQQYSMKGRQILVHCRGGVGRAGVIACCWLIRFGLCGWTSGQAADGTLDTVAFVREVISLVRKRRSMKAIETYEQVKFLVEYVEYLRTFETKDNMSRDTAV